jgi:hypothetical protein
MMKKDYFVSAGEAHGGIAHAAAGAAHPNVIAAVAAHPAVATHPAVAAHAAVALHHEQSIWMRMTLTLDSDSW